MGRALLALPMQLAAFGERADVRYQLLQSLSCRLIAFHIVYEVPAEITPNRNCRKESFLRRHYKNLTPNNSYNIVRAAAGRSLGRRFPAA